MGFSKLADFVSDAFFSVSHRIRFVVVGIRGKNGSEIFVVGRDLIARSQSHQHIECNKDEPGDVWIKRPALLARSISEKESRAPRRRAKTITQSRS